MNKPQTDSLLGSIVGYAEDNQNKPIWSATKEIKVKLFDWNKVIEKLKEQLPPLEEGAEYKIMSGKGIIFVPSENDKDTKVPLLIDNECCGLEGEEKNIFFDGVCSTRTVLSGIGVFLKKPNSIPMFPKYYFDFDFADIEKAYTGEEKELWEYMESRYEYNPRIHNNMREIVRVSKGIFPQNLKNQLINK
jgi:hypothetical protein